MGGMVVQTALSISNLSGAPVLMFVIGRFERWVEKEVGGWMVGEGKREESALGTRGMFVTWRHNPRTLAYSPRLSKASLQFNITCDSMKILA